MFNYCANARCKPVSGISAAHTLRFSDFYHFTIFFSNCTSPTCIFIFSCFAGGSFHWFIPIVCRRQMKKSKSLFVVVLRAYFTTSFFYVFNCRLNLLAVLSSFQLHKRFLSDPGPNRNKLLLLRLDLCLSGWCCCKIYQHFIMSFFSENGVPPFTFSSPTPYHLNI